MLVIFPFEEEIYRRAGIPVEWVGHPLLDVAPRCRAARRVSARATGSIRRGRWSRCCPAAGRNEVRAILPGLRARVGDRPSPGAAGAVRAGAGAASPRRAVRAARGDTQPPITALDGAADDVLAAADVALVASGTVTVQAALHECPMVVVYRLSPLTYRLGRPFVHVDTFAMANLVAGRQIVPELMQDDVHAGGGGGAGADAADAIAEAAARMRARSARGEGEARRTGREPARGGGGAGRGGRDSARSVWGRLLAWDV